MRGLDEPDEGQIVGTQTDGLDGTISETIIGFRRVITAGLGILQESADRAYMLEFASAQDRWITMSPMGSVHLVLEDPAKFANEWKNGSSLARRYTVRLVENVLQTTWPTYADPVVEELAYIKTHVQITNTPDSPQTLTTNAGALATDDTGNAYPAINLATYAASVIIQPEQECDCMRVSSITQSGTDITFQVAHSYAGNAYADGNFYAQITILLEAL